MHVCVWCDGSGGRGVQGGCGPVRVYVSVDYARQTTTTLSTAPALLTAPWKSGSLKFGAKVALCTTHVQVSAFCDSHTGGGFP